MAVCESHRRSLTGGALMPDGGRASSSAIGQDGSGEGRFVPFSRATCSSVKHARPTAEVLAERPFRG
jgi:hypothetical protein